MAEWMIETMKHSYRMKAAAYSGVCVYAIEHGLEYEATLAAINASRYAFLAHPELREPEAK